MRFQYIHGQKVATNTFQFENDSYLLIVNYTSRFPIVHKLTSTMAQQVASQMKLIFSEFGWPETIISDNSPCYSAETFTKLMIDYNVNHITSSPHYLQSNGLAQKNVQIVKNLFYKAKVEGTDLYKNLMIYRNTPLSHKLQSPIQILQAWAARTQLPMPSVARIQQGLGSEQLRVSNKYDHLPTHDFHMGQSVMYLNPMNKRWYPTTIMNLCQEPQSYKIKTDVGTIYRKTKNNLKPCQQNGDEISNDNTWTITSDIKQSNGNNNQVRAKIMLVNIQHLHLPPNMSAT